MKNQEYLADDCKKDKELFNSYLRALILLIIFLIFIEKNGREREQNVERELKKRKKGYREKEK